MTRVLAGQEKRKARAKNEDVKTPRIKVNVEKERNNEKKKCKTIGIDRVLTESSTGSSLYFDTARGPRSVCTMPVTGKTSGVVWDRISSFDAE
jgi:hypothetical protein